MVMEVSRIYSFKGIESTRVKRMAIEDPDQREHTSPQDAVLGNRKAGID